ncbi:MAG: hypothetical protein OCD01_18490, partial [Fibrobacterales bacterium]
MFYIKHTYIQKFVLWAFISNAALFAHTSSHQTIITSSSSQSSGAVLSSSILSSSSDALSSSQALREGCGIDSVFCACALDDGGVRVIFEDTVSHTNVKFYIGKGDQSQKGLYHSNVSGKSNNNGASFFYDDNHTSHDYTGDIIHFNVFANHTWLPGSRSDDMVYIDHSEISTCLVPLSSSSSSVSSSSS